MSQDAAAAAEVLVLVRFYAETQFIRAATNNHYECKHLECNRFDFCRVLLSMNSYFFLIPNHFKPLIPRNTLDAYQCEVARLYCGLNLIFDHFECLNILPISISVIRIFWLNCLKPASDPLGMVNLAYAILFITILQHHFKWCHSANPNTFKAVKKLL